VALLDNSCGLKALSLGRPPPSLGFTLRQWAVPSVIGFCPLSLGSALCVFFPPSSSSCHFPLPLRRATPLHLIVVSSPVLSFGSPFVHRSFGWLLSFASGFAMAASCWPPLSRRGSLCRRCAPLDVVVGFYPSSSGLVVVVFAAPAWWSVVVVVVITCWVVFVDGG
jgi:hypothetical protein